MAEDTNCAQIKNVKIFKNFFKKVWKLFFLSYLCNPKTNKAVVVKWQTRYFEGVVGVILCEFESRPPHQEISKMLVSFFVLSHSLIWVPVHKTPHFHGQTHHFYACIHKNRPFRGQASIIYQETSARSKSMNNVFKSCPTL